MRFHNITTDDMLNGTGLRVVLWVSACEHHCIGCHNPVTWDENEGLVFSDEHEEELFNKLSKSYIKGITFSGGDPLHPANRSKIQHLCLKVRELFPSKDIWVYTGYTWEEILEFQEYIKNVDVLVDGKFVQEQSDKSLHWKGSSNQRLIDVQKSITNNKIILWEDSTKEEI